MSEIKTKELILYNEALSQLSQVCNETDAQLIISKYKKNIMKRKEEKRRKKSFIQKQEDNVL